MFWPSRIQQSIVQFPLDDKEPDVTVNVFAAEPETRYHPLAELPLVIVNRT
jgi:hypothetical protein